MALEDASSRLLGERWADEQREAKLMAAADAESAGARDALAPGATALSSELALCVRGAHVRMLRGPISVVVAAPRLRVPDLAGEAAAKAARKAAKAERDKDREKRKGGKRGGSSRLHAPAESDEGSESEASTTRDGQSARDSARRERRRSEEPRSTRSTAAAAAAAPADYMYECDAYSRILKNLRI